MPEIERIIDRQDRHWIVGSPPPGDAEDKIMEISVGQLGQDEGPWGIMVWLVSDGEIFLPGDMIASISFPATRGAANSATEAQEAAATKHAFQGQPGAKQCELCGMGPNSVNHRSLTR